MRRSRSTAVLAAVLVAAMVAPTGIVASEGGLGGLVSGARDDLGPRGSGVDVGGVGDRLSDGVRERIGPAVEAISRPKKIDGRRDSGEAGSRRDTQGARSIRSAGAVEIKDFLYQPETVTIGVGETVTWTNADSAPHDAKAFDGSFQTQIMEEGDSDTVTFEQAGTYRYFCSLHPPEDFPEFTGKVVVAAGGGTSGSGSGDGGTGQGSSGGGTGADTPVSSDDGTGGAGGSGGPAGSGAGQESGSGGGSDLASTGLEPLPMAAFAGLLLALGLLIRPRGSGT